MTLPLIMPGVIAGFLLAFVLSLDDFVITNFVAGSETTFPTWVFGATRIGVPPQVNVMGHAAVRASASLDRPGEQHPLGRKQARRGRGVEHGRPDVQRVTIPARPPPRLREIFHKLTEKTASDLRKRVLATLTRADGPPLYWRAHGGRRQRDSCLGRHGDGVGDHVDDDRRGSLAWGGLGYLVDRLVGTVARVPRDRLRPRARAAAIYMVWLRYGRGEGGEQLSLSAS